MRQTLSILNSVTIPASSEVNVQAVLTDLSNYNFNNITLESSIVNGSTPPTALTRIIVYYIFSSHLISASQAPGQFDAAKQVFAATLSSVPNSTYGALSVSIPVQGNYLYTWISHNTIGSPVTMSLSLNDSSALDPNQAGGIIVPTTTTETTSAITSATVSTLLAGANILRSALTIFNAANTPMYVKHGDSASTASFKVKLFPTDYYEIGLPIYQGDVTAIWDATPTGSANVCEGSAINIAVQVPTLVTEITTQIAASSSTVTLAAANSSRKVFSVYNAANVALYVKLGSGASSSSFKATILPGDYYAIGLPIYQGIITGVWQSSPTGFAYISEG